MKKNSIVTLALNIITLVGLIGLPFVIVPG